MLTLLDQCMISHLKYKSISNSDYKVFLANNYNSDTSGGMLDTSGWLFPEKTQQKQNCSMKPRNHSCHETSFKLLIRSIKYQFWFAGFSYKQTIVLLNPKQSRTLTHAHALSLSRSLAVSPTIVKSLYCRVT